VAHDFNADARLDLVVANTESNTLSVLLGDGHGGFQPAVNYSTINYCWSIGVGDFNGDDWPDIIFQDNNGQIVFWIMHGVTISRVGSFSDPIPTSWQIVVPR
jgi:hypothetical protein